MATARSRQALGAYGERLAARYLVGAGMVVLARNYRCPGGEADLVLGEGPVLVVCEVKTRRGTDFGHPLEAVDEEKVGRMRRLAAHWCAHAPAGPAPLGTGTPGGIRLDMVGILLPVRGAPRIEHVRGIGG